MKSEDPGLRVDTRSNPSVSATVKAAILSLLTVVLSQQASAQFRVVSTAPMNVARSSHVAAQLLDGRILIVGGVVAGGETVLPAEIYDPATNTFALTGPMVSGRRGHVAVTLPDGRVLVLGGSSCGASIEPDTAEIYDPETGRFTILLELLHCRLFPTATLLPDGRVLVFGGNPDGVAEVIDPKTKTTFQVFSPNRTVGSHTATLLEDGTVLITGGYIHLGLVRTRTLDLAEIFDPTSNTFFPVGNMTVARQAHTATSLPDGRVLIAGGLRQILPHIFLSSVEIFDQETQRFSDSQVITLPRAGAAAILFPGGRVVITGGGVSEVLVVAHANVVVEQLPSLGFLPASRSVVKISDHVAFIPSENSVLLVFETRRRAVRR